jgi:hypothetical protein
MHPDHIVGLEQSPQFLSKSPIDPLVCLVLLVRIAEAVHKVVKQRPKDGIAKAEIEILVVALIEMRRSVTDVSVANRRGRLHDSFCCFPVPPEPEPPAGLHRRYQSHR